METILISVVDGQRQKDDNGIWDNLENDGDYWDDVDNDWEDEGKMRAMIGMNKGNDGNGDVGKIRATSPKGSFGDGSKTSPLCAFSN